MEHGDAARTSLEPWHNLSKHRNPQCFRKLERLGVNTRTLTGDSGSLDLGGRRELFGSGPFDQLWRPPCRPVSHAETTSPFSQAQTAKTAPCFAACRISLPVARSLIPSEPASLDCNLTMFSSSPALVAWI